MNVVSESVVKYNHFQLHKFGGSSLANKKCYQRVANIMVNYSQPGDLMVVSASGKTTNQLIDWLKLSRTDHILANRMQDLISFHQQELIIGLLPGRKGKELKVDFLSDLDRLTSLVNRSTCDDLDVYAEIVAYGEIWSARLMASLLEEFGLSSQWLDSRLFLRAEFSYLPQVDETASGPLLEQLLQQYPNKLLVITGFIAQSREGKTVLLGRNGSDYSATQVGALAKVNKITIWSDVPGIYSADPRRVKGASLLPSLRFDEARELARLEAPIFHVRTLEPISVSNIDLQLRSSYNPEQGSTKIERVLSSDEGVKIITSHDDVCLVEINLANQKNFNQIYRNINFLLKRKDLRPLASVLHSDQKLIQLCYVSEMAYNACIVLEEMLLVEELSLRHHFSLVALIGAGIAKNPFYSRFFCQELKNHPVEFVYRSEEKISLVAVLRIIQTSHVVQELHQRLLREEKRTDLILLNKESISSFFKIVQD